MNLTYRISQRGAISIYGMGRFPVTLYPEAILALGAEMPKIVAFVKANGKACEEQGENFAAAEAIADTRGLVKGPVRDAFIADLLGMNKATPKVTTAKADLVAKLEAKLKAQGK